MSTARAKKLPASVAPHECVVLGLDPSSRTGWAIFARGRRIESGVVVLKHTDRMRNVIRAAKALAERERIPLIVVAERWTAGGWKTHSSIIAMGVSWGIIETLLKAELVLASQRVRVYPQTWRAATIGGRRLSDEWKRAARGHVEKRFGAIVGDDEAEANMMAFWGCYARAVGEALARMAA